MGPYGPHIRRPYKHDLPPLIELPGATQCVAADLAAAVAALATQPPSALCRQVTAQLDASGRITTRVVMLRIKLWPLQAATARPCRRYRLIGPAISRYAGHGPPLMLCMKWRRQCFSIAGRGRPAARPLGGGDLVALRPQGSADKYTNRVHN
jgi:hypothetical protein